MSLGIVIKGPEGLVLAAESRVTITARMPDGTMVPVNFDNARKLLKFQKPHNYVGAVTYGLGGIGLRTAYSFLSEFEASLPNERLKVEEYADRMSKFFMQRWTDASPPPPPTGMPPQNITFVVGGFDKKQPYGEVYIMDIPTSPTPKKQHEGIYFGITWGGQREIVDRLLRGYDERIIGIVQKMFSLNQTQTENLVSNFNQLILQIPIQFLSLQDSVDLALLFIRTTIETQKLTTGIRGCGGPIDVATITGEGFKVVQEKEIRGEYPAFLREKFS